MESFLKSLPRAIEFGEVATGDKDAGRMGHAGLKIEAKIQEKRKADANMSYSEALTAVQRENPELAAEYASEIGR